MPFGIILKTTMQNCKVTQAELAEKADVSQGAISRYMNDKASPKAEELLRIAQALGVTMEYLLTGNGDAPLQPVHTRSFREMKAETQKLLRQLEAVEETAKRLRGFLD